MPRRRGFYVPLFSYFLVVGSVLAVFFFYAETVMVPRSLPFGAQKIELAKSHNEPTSLPTPHMEPPPWLK